MNLFLGVAALLVADHHARLAVKARQTTDDGVVVGKGAIAVQLFEVAEDVLDVVEGIWALRVTCHQCDLPRRQLGVDILGQRQALGLEPADLLGNIDSGVVLNEAELLYFFLELGDRLLEV